MFQSVQIPHSHPGYEFGVKFTTAPDDPSPLYGIVAITDTPSPFTPGQILVTARARQVEANGQTVVVDGRPVEAAPISRQFDRAEYDATHLDQLWQDAAAALELLLHAATSPETAITAEGAS